MSAKKGLKRDKTHTLLIYLTRYKVFADCTYLAHSGHNPNFAPPRHNREICTMRGNFSYSRHSRLLESVWLSSPAVNPVHRTQRYVAVPGSIAFLHCSTRSAFCQVEFSTSRKLTLSLFAVRPFPVRSAYFNCITGRFVCQALFLIFQIFFGLPSGL